MPQYMLLLNDTPQDYTGMSPDELQAIVAKYFAWRERMAEEGRLVDGVKLTDEGGRWIARADDGGVRVTDGPYSETKEVIGGYFTIEATDYDEAVEVAKTCPHVEYGSSISVRQVDAMHDD